MSSPVDRKKQYAKRKEALTSHRQSNWDPEWKDIAENILPRRSRFFTSETNKGTKGRERKRGIINSKPTIAARTLRALMVSGMASPARRWFVGSVADPALKEVQSVKDWAFRVEGEIRDTLKKSNFYQAVDNVLGDLGSFGTSVLIVEEDLESTIRCYVLPIGSYVLAADAHHRIDTLFRDTVFTVRQLVRDFGEKKCSTRVKQAYAQGRYEEEIEVVHLICPNEDYQPGKTGPEGMRFLSCWFEKNEGVADDPPFLREAGYYEAPFFAPRWNVTGEDVYGSDCPGMEAIGDAKVLQLTATREEQAFDKSVNPPMVGSTSLIGQRTSLLAGDITYADGDRGRFEPALVINPGTLERFAQKVDRLERSIETAYYADLALMFQRLSMGKMTATEINARQQEQMLLLGSVMERSEEELLRPVLYRVFMVLWRQGRIPPPPEELEGAELKFDFVSIMSQAQKLLQLNSIKELVGLVMGVAGTMGSAAFDKLNWDQAVDEVADALAVPPAVIRSDDEVAEMRAARAEQAQQAQAAEQAAAVAAGAKDLSQASLEDDNALSRVMGGDLLGRQPATA